MTTDAAWESVPDWIQRLIDDGTAAYGGLTTVKSPASLKGSEAGSIALRNRDDAERVEIIARSNGYRVRNPGRRWDDGSGGTISIIPSSEVPRWRAAGFFDE